MLYKVAKNIKKCPFCGSSSLCRYADDTADMTKFFSRCFACQRDFNESILYKLPFKEHLI